VDDGPPPPPGRTAPPGPIRPTTDRLQGEQKANYNKAVRRASFPVSWCLKTYQDGSVPLVIEGRKLYRIGEALVVASVSRATYFRWLKLGLLKDTQFKDRNGRRVFTEDELEELKRESQKLVQSPQIPLTFQ
jgi:hypothetical protein